MINMNNKQIKGMPTTITYPKLGVSTRCHSEARLAPKKGYVLVNLPDKREILCYVVGRMGGGRLFDELSAVYVGI